MARPRKNTPVSEHLLIKEDPKTEIQKILAHLEDNYKLYIAGIVFVVLCVAIGALIRVSAQIKDREIMTAYAEAALIEDAGERLARYESIRDSSGRWTAEVLYMMGETAVEAGEYDVARDVFARILSHHGGSDFVVGARDALGFLDWNDGNLEAALEAFTSLVADMPTNFLARRRHVDIGSILEELERPQEAMDAYKRQVSAFPESAAAMRAERAMNDLRDKYPDLFPQEADPLDGDADITDAVISDDGAATPYLSSDAAVFVDGPADDEDAGQSGMSDSDDVEADVVDEDDQEDESISPEDNADAAQQ